MSKSGNFVCFQVAKRAAFYNGLSAWMQSEDTEPFVQVKYLLVVTNSYYY